MSPHYRERSFLVASDDERSAFLELVTGSEPFDEAIFLELSADLSPTKTRFRRPLASTQFLLAIPKDDLALELHQRLAYED